MHKALLRSTLVIAFGLIITAPGVYAASTVAQERAIRENCTDIRSTLDRVYTNDTLMRVTQGRAYDSFSASLMLPFNARVTLNGKEASGLVATTNEYQAQVEAFRKSYQKYERLLANLREVDCTKQPAIFYEKLTAVRIARADVRTATGTITDTLESYRAQVIQLQKESEVPQP